MRRTRVKICGITRIEDAVEAVSCGADAVGFVCYERSPRFVPRARLRELARSLPPFVTPVLLFVNAAAAEVRACLAEVPAALLQFHGDETAADCERFARPYLRAVPIGGQSDLLDCQRVFHSAIALLADAPTAGFGGGGTVFDWSRLPAPRSRTMPLVLAGGLDEDNVSDAIARVRPFAVDVSSRVESAPGIKSAERIARFCAAVRLADRREHPEPSDTA
ncbi:MAG: phosphoribosylanthranilate isomerase [Burkholderiales bacterium]|jgi:phosphoribosylanthranilate isomerase|nr:phosphoribosylanthranilate isomerase [Burkholderiales bacterium]